MSDAYLAHPGRGKNSSLTSWRTGFGVLSVGLLFTALIAAYSLNGLDRNKRVEQLVQVRTN
jgi:hypothetical protein